MKQILNNLNNFLLTLALTVQNWSCHSVNHCYGMCKLSLTTSIDRIFAECTAIFGFWSLRRQMGTKSMAICWVLSLWQSVGYWAYGNLLGTESMVITLLDRLVLVVILPDYTVTFWYRTRCACSYALITTRRVYHANTVSQHIIPHPHYTILYRIALYHAASVSYTTML